MYETYPGSRFTQPPFNAGPSNENADQMIEIRESMVRAVSESIAQGFSSRPTPIINVNMGPVVERIVQLQTELVAAVSQNIETGVRSAISELATQLRSIPQSMPAVTPGTSIEAAASVTDDLSGETVDKPAQIIADDFADMPSLVRRTSNQEPPPVPHEVIADIEGIVGTMPTAQSTQKSLVAQETLPTKSDNELMAVELPEDSVTMSQIIEELRSEVCEHFYAI